MFRLVAFAVGAACLTIPAAAQDGSEVAERRTVEGAQKFLADFYQDNSAVGRLEIWAAMASQGDGKLRPTGEWALHRAPQPLGFRMEFLDGDMIGIRNIERCKTSVKLDKLRTAVFFPNSLSGPLQLPTQGVTEVIDWGKVQKISVVAGIRFDDEGNRIKTGDTLVLITRKKDQKFSFIHRFEEDAKRAAFAMDFLRENCAPRNDTGF